MSFLVNFGKMAWFKFRAGTLSDLTLGLIFLMFPKKFLIQFHRHLIAVQGFPLFQWENSGYYFILVFILYSCEKLQIFTTSGILKRKKINSQSCLILGSHDHKVTFFPTFARLDPSYQRREPDPDRDMCH